MIYLAYDGSLNGDWISRYAIRLAANSPSRALTVLHVLDREIPEEALQASLDDIETACADAGVTCLRDVRPLTRNVASALIAPLPVDPEAFVVCGTRTGFQGRGFLTGTISEQLLRRAPCNVLALRILQPGLLGHPGDVLVPLFTRGATHAFLPFLRLVAPDLTALHVLQIVSINRWRLQRMPARDVSRYSRGGSAKLDAALAAIRETCDPDTFYLDGQVTVTDDWRREVVLSASRLKAHLILAGPMERLLPNRFLSGYAFEKMLRRAPCDVGIYRGV